ncbi:ADP-ribosylglycohydrolase family protein [Sandaracinus amylolyticus]|uniref:ADP-ribosylglycohydrolase family protein n=1 Tax=Sandaracinus amylolyticus TaxID=927083 RepID=UPI001F1A38A2|nr:ADP-ribosylglycohydrolase family protein [Sandaracinus amylolyticus]UJR80645.1 Putative ADP-ribosylglycohydrolase [Sandaracinus amylolyticus]
MGERRGSGDGTLQLDLLGGEVVRPTKSSPGTVAAEGPMKVTSSTHPLRVTWIEPRIGLAHAPGVVEIAESGIEWSRDLASDLDALRAEGADVLVDLTTDEERARGGYGAIDDLADERELVLIRLPVAPEDAPGEDAHEVLERIESHVSEDAKVVLISREGMGRAGMIAAALQVRAGRDLDDVLRALREVRGRKVAASEAQREWLEQIAQHVEAASAIDDGEEGDLWSARELDDDLDPDLPEAAIRETIPPDIRPATPRARALSPRASAIAGSVLGAAIGDAMGHPTEFMSLEAIRRKWPPHGVTTFELYWERGGKRFAPYTDDTQMAEAVLRSLLWSRREGADLDATMQHMARSFVEWAERPQGGHRAPGNACLSGSRALARGEHWSRAGGATAGGCGSVMRAYPFGLLYAHDLSRCEEWSVAHSKLTHRDPIALAASAAMAIGVARVLRGDPTRVVLSEMIAAAARYSARTAVMMAEALDDADGGVAPETTLDRLRGWAAHEAIAAAVYLFARSPDDPERAILEGANSPGDSDSLATLAGALAGARAGLGALPDAWVRDVERSDDLLALALEI